MYKTDFHIHTKGRKKEKYSLDQYFSPEIFAFHKSLPGYTATPLIDLKLKNTGVNILLKDESQRFSMGAFKSLGASWAIANHLKQNKGNFTFCSATDGNHGRAVAWSARIFGHRAEIYMPSSTVTSRIRSIEKEGARVIVVDGDYDEAVNTARNASKNENYVLIQDTSWKDYKHYPNLISAGYSTILKEIEEQLRRPEDFPEIVILQSGVGSWAASIMLYISRFTGFKTPKFIIVEPYESDCLLESAKNCKISTTRKSQNTIMAGLNCGTPSLLAWEIINDHADIFLSIDDRFIETALKELHLAGIQSCESGAAGMGGLLALLNEDHLEPLRKTLSVSNTSKFMIFNTEGITDPAMYAKIINELE
ncbi:MAG: diaminopropionate ammonia-lyase [Bacteroidota bacterium]